MFAIENISSAFNEIDNSWVGLAGFDLESEQVLVEAHEGTLGVRAKLHYYSLYTALRIFFGQPR